MLLRTASLALAAGLALGSAPTVLAAPAPAPVAEHVATHHVASAPTPSTHDATRYAQREQQSPAAASFAGGSAVIIGISGASIAVLLILVLLLA